MISKTSAFLIAFLFLLTACAGTEQATDHIKLSPASFGDLVGWPKDNLSDAGPILAYYCPKLMKRDPQWDDFCTRLASTPQIATALRGLMESCLTPFAAAGNSGDTGLFTGYYEASLRGSFKPHDTYQTPLYAHPDDLVTADLSLFKPEWSGKHLTGRVVNGKLIPYDTRAAIDEGSLNNRAKPLLWVDDPVDAFFLAIQGSGRVQMDNGETVQVGYDSANGQSYNAIGRTLADGGDIEKPVTMQKIRAWLATHHERAKVVMQSNPSFVFFRILPSGGPVGAAAHPLTPLRSLAIDPSFVPYGTPIWLDTATGDKSLQRLMIAEDTGGAIRGPVRGDVFWGFGRDAEQSAGAMQSLGKYYFLSPKPHCTLP